MHNTTDNLVADTDPRSYVLVFHGDSSWLVALPSTGELVVGRDEAAGLRLLGADVAAQHARLVMADGEATLVNLAGPGSTLVNGETLVRARVLTSGDALRMGAATLVFHHGPGRARRAWLDAALLRQRLREETERSLRTSRPLAVLVVQLATAPQEQLARARDVLLAAVRTVDVVGGDGAGEFVLLMPETAETARIPSARLMDALVRLELGARAGLALCPQDARDPDALLTGARAAARQAAPGEVVLVSQAAPPIRLGERTVLAVDPKMRSIFTLVQRLAASDMPVLVTGETGAGKEVVSLALHVLSPRKDKPLVTINCAAIAESLFESELFGHERGAFTGAVAAKTGLLESASGGTVVLDEVGECSLAAQAKLLRAIETRRVSRVGSVVEHPIDVRIVAATNRSLEADVSAGRFRQDLFFRLGAATVIVPPLRERPLDLPALARAFLEDACTRLARLPLVLTAETMQRLALYSWPGNVRELKNLMDYLAATVDGPVLEVNHLPARVADAVPWMKRLAAPGNGENHNGNGHHGNGHHGEGKRFRNIYDEIRDLERTRILEALGETGGVRVRAAELIGMPLRTLVTKLKEYNITSPPPRGVRKTVAKEV